MFLFPVPQKIESTGRFFDHSTRTFIKLNTFDHLIRKGVMRALDALRCRTACRFCLTAGTVHADKILAELSIDETKGQEEYHISITASGTEITAGGAPGLVYGFETFLQIAAEAPGKIPELEIDDKPLLAHRGYMLDISRCKVPSMSSLKKMIDSLAALRCNELQLYTEHTFAFQGHERVWADFSPVTPEEIMELDIYCSERFIELVPNQNSFGHLERWLKNPAYTHLAESITPWHYEPWDADYQATLYPSDEAIEFIRGLYSRMLPNFSSSTVNIGCDETLELGNGRSLERCRREGTHTVYLDFLTRLNALAGEFGKKVQFWGDIILHTPELISKLPANITAMEWGYEANHPFAEDCGKFAASGIPFYVCPGTSTWNTFIGRTSNMIANIVSACSEGAKAGAAGMLLTDWGDGGHHQYWPFSWPGISLSMACAWNPEAASEHIRLLPEAVKVFFDNRSHGGALGAALLELGDIYKCFPAEVNINSAVWCSIFFRKEDSARAASLLGMITPAMTRNALKKLKSWHRRFIASPPTDDELIIREITNGVLMTICALEYMLYRQKCRINKQKWRDTMTEVIAGHESLWLARNRRGGLHESSENLRKCLAKVR